MELSSPKRSLFLGALLLAVSAGCGGPKVVPVSGRVTLDGNPLAGARISFEPVKGTVDELSIATTDADGRYQLKNFSSDRMGAVPNGTSGLVVRTYVDRLNSVCADR